MARLLVIGDFVREQSVNFLREHEIVDGCILDFTTANLIKVLHNWGKHHAPPENFTIRQGGEILAGPMKLSSTRFTAPLPHHEKFEIGRYSQPINRKLPMATVLGSVGCPFQCGFCSQGTIAYSTRSADEIIDELKFLKEMGVREVLFRDQLMEGNKGNFRSLCQAMIVEDLGLTWYCNSRADTLDGELIALMKRAGCHSVMMGIETANEGVLDQLNTRKTNRKTDSTIDLLRRNGISVVGYFILGLPGESSKSVQETIDFARGLDIDFASFSTPSPDYGTQLRKEAVARGLIDRDAIMNSDRSQDIFGLNSEISVGEIRRLRRRAYRAFYFRPKIILRIAVIAGMRPRFILNVLNNLFRLLANQFLPALAAKR